VANDRGLFADFWTIFFGKIFIAEGAMEIHSRPQHVRVDDKDFLTTWTSDFNRLTHGLPLDHFGFSIFRTLRPRHCDISKFARLAQSFHWLL